MPDCLDRDFGPFFLKFCSYLPYPAKLCLNGHEYLKCQLRQRGIPFEAMDNGLFSCADLRRLRLHGVIERIPKTHRDRLTAFGFKTALFYSRTYYRFLRRGLSELHDPRVAHSSTHQASFNQFQRRLDAFVTETRAA
jgi:hypothetical protein